MKTAKAKGYTIGRSANAGQFVTIIVPGRGPVGVINRDSYRAAKEAAGYRIKSASTNAASDKRR